MRSNSLCVILLPSNRHTERLHSLVHERQRIWLPVGLGLFANAVHSQCDTCRQPEWHLQLSATTLTSRETSAFCGRWNDRLGPAHSLSLTMAANERSCKHVMPLVGTELQTSALSDVSNRLVILQYQMAAVELITCDPAALENKD